MTACPTCGHNPAEPTSFAAERAAYYQSAWRGQRDLARDLARQVAALKEKQK